MVKLFEWGDEKPRENQIKINQDDRLLSCHGGAAQVHVTPQEVSLTNASNGVVVNDYGTVVDGKVHLGRVPSDIRIASFWVLNDELLTTLPSTTYTPIPVLRYSEPPYIKWLQKFSRFVSGLG